MMTLTIDSNQLESIDEKTEKTHELLLDLKEVNQTVQLTVT